MIEKSVSYHNTADDIPEAIKTQFLSVSLNCVFFSCTFFFDIVSCHLAVS